MIEPPAAINGSAFCTVNSVQARHRGVSDKMPIQQLKEMQADGVIDRVDFKEIPP